MKRTVFALSLLLVCALSYGQTAKSVLDKAAAVVSNKGGITADFGMKGGMGNVSGSIAVKGRKFHANTPTRPSCRKSIPTTSLISTRRATTSR